MTTPYRIEHGASNRRSAVAQWLAGLDLVSPEVRERIVTGWVSAWESSPYDTLEDMPYSLNAPEYRLMDHVNEVTRTGIDLARRARAEWGMEFDNDVLVSILVMHDVDKPLMYAREDGRVVASQLSRELPHGVVGAMMLKELGFPHAVVSVVATHAANAPFHGSGIEAYVLHYADFFSTDHAMMLAGTKPFYQRHVT
jgi:putative nucleotidyltransferase with HDIG domain